MFLITKRVIPHSSFVNIDKRREKPLDKIENIEGSAIVLARMFSVYLKVAMHPLCTLSRMSIRQELLEYEGNECLLHPAWLGTGNLTGITRG